MKKTLLLQAALAALILPAAAQENADEPVKVEDTVFVTIPGPERSADELIGNATALDRDELLDILEPSLGNTLAKEPGISSTYYGPAASRPIVRGLGAERVLVLTNSLGVIDVSAASPDHQVTTDGIDAERVEILRGPAALAYGGQAIGGVVNVIDGLIAEDIPDAPNGDALFAYNDVNEGTDLAARGEFAAGPFVFNLSASYRDADNVEIPGFAESSFQRALEEAEHEEEDHDDEDHEDEDDHDHEEEEVRGLIENSFLETTTLAGGASWVGDNAFFGIAVRQTDSEYGLPGGHAHAHEHEGEEEGEEHEEEEHGEEEENPFIDLSQTRVDLRGGIQLDDAPITQVTAGLSFSDYEHTEFEAPGEAGTVFDTTGHELRIEAMHAPVFGFQGTFGVQQSDKEFSAIGEEAFISPTDTERFALFLYEVREWGDVFGIEGGLRFENAKLTNAISGDRDFDTFSGSLGVHGHPSEHFFVGLQLAVTERAPTDVELFANGPHLATQQFEVGDSSLDVETGINAEATMRLELDNVTVGVNFFATDFDDFIYLAPDGTEEDELPVFNFLQEDASFIGGEIYANAALGKFLAADWDLNASIDFVEGEIADGGPVPLQPPTTVQLGAMGDWGAFAAGFDVTVADEQTDLADSELPTDGYTLLDLRAEYDISAFSGPLGEGSKVFIEARNVTDEEARAATSVLKDSVPLPGRNIRAGLRISF